MSADSTVNEFQDGGKTLKRRSENQRVIRSFSSVLKFMHTFTDRRYSSLVARGDFFGITIA